MNNKVLIVDDHPVICLAVRILLERNNYQVVAETDNGVDALQLARTHLPDLIILDMGIPKLDGLAVIDRLVSCAQTARVLVFSQQTPSHMAVRCMLAGAAAYVWKKNDLSELMNAVKAVSSGQRYFPDVPDSIHANDKLNSESALFGRLSDREIMVLKQLAEGLSNKEIGDRMLLSNKTISTYKTRLLAKLNTNSLADLIEFSKRHGLV